MATPFDFLGGMQKLLASLQPPAWLVQEGQNRIVLSLNHVLKQEPLAMERLAKQSGKSVLITLAPWSLHAQATPAGLLDLVPDARQHPVFVELPQAQYARLRGAWKLPEIEQ